MTHRMRAVLLSIAAVVAVAMGFFAWYRVHFAMAPAQELSVNDPSLEPRVLIATQGSAFKDALVAGLIERLRERPSFVRVVDVSALADTDADAWDAIVILHTIEYGRAPAPAQAFVDRTGDRSRIVVMSTSGAGDFTMQGIDALAAASRLGEVATRVEEILALVESALARSGD